MWNAINIDDEFTPPIETIQTWLTRSGDIPLHLDIFWYEEGDEDCRAVIFEVLLETCSRWEKIDLLLQPPQLVQLDDVTEPMPTLLNLVIGTQSGLDRLYEGRLRAFKAAPALKELEISSKPQLYLIPWSQLTSFTLQYSSVKGCLWSMGQCVNLERCSIAALDDTDEVAFYPTVPSGPKPQTYARLEFWSIDVVKLNFFSPLLDSVTAPNLESLVLDVIYLAYVPLDVASIPMIPFLTRSKCQLSSLGLRGSILSETDLIDVLQHLPSLINLLVYQSPNDDSPPIFGKQLWEGLTSSHLGTKTSALGSPLLVPQLEKLSFTGQMDVDGDILLKMIRSRIGSAGEITAKCPVAQLQDISLRIWRDDGGLELGTDLRRQLSVWKDEGNSININVTRSRSWY